MAGDGSVCRYSHTSAWSCMNMPAARNASAKPLRSMLPLFADTIVMQYASSGTPIHWRAGTAPSLPSTNSVALKMLVSMACGTYRVSIPALSMASLPNLDMAIGVTFGRASHCNTGAGAGKWSIGTHDATRSRTSHPLPLNTHASKSVITAACWPVGRPKSIA